MIAPELLGLVAILMPGAELYIPFERDAGLRVVRGQWVRIQEEVVHLVGRLALKHL